MRRNMANRKAELCRCIDCAMAKVYQYGTDPVIAECDDGTRNVANSLVMCTRSEILREIRCIENLPKKYWFQK